MDTRTKILRLDRALELLAELAADGKRIAVAMGWFDVLRSSHTQALAGALAGALGGALSAERPSADVLAVAVFADGGDDGSGGGRTLLDESSRAQLAAALAVVDYVVICERSEVEGLRSAAASPVVVDAEALATGNVVDDVLRRHGKL